MAILKFFLPRTFIIWNCSVRKIRPFSAIYLFSISTDSCLFILLIRLKPSTITIYFVAQIVLTLSAGSSFKLAPVFF